MKRILFVCTGNICRSPTAEAVARHFVETGGLGAQVLLDSAGTQATYVGEAPDPRTQKAAKLRGYDLSALRARKLEIRWRLPGVRPAAGDGPRASRAHAAALPRGVSAQAAALPCPSPGRERYGEEVPDPYYGGPKGFDLVLDMCEDGARGIVERVRRGAEPGTGLGAGSASAGTGALVVRELDSRAAVASAAAAPHDLPERRGSDTLSRSISPLRRSGPQAALRPRQPWRRACGRFP